MSVSLPPSSPPSSPRSPQRKVTRKSTRQATLDLGGNRPGKSIFIVPLTPAPPVLDSKLGPPSHRHGTPSGPWPWVDIGDEVTPDSGVNAAMRPGSCPHIRSASPLSMMDSPPMKLSPLYTLNEDEPASPPPLHYPESATIDYCWCQYPQSLFPNWTVQQRQKSRIAKIVARNHASQVFELDVRKDGRFINPKRWNIVDHHRPGRHAEEKTHEEWWDILGEERLNDTHVRAMFIDNLSGPVLQLLGTKFNVEPFFFSSSLGWIPSRYREAVIPGKGDHITITLTFLRSMPNPKIATPASPDTPDDEGEEEPEDIIIDTQAPLQLHSSNVILVPDLLSLHLIRAPTNARGGCTLISYHHNDYTYKSEYPSALTLRNRLYSTGRSVYWSNIFQSSKDPTFVLLSLLWYPLYAWDEALERLYTHLCELEAKVIGTNDMQMTQELHLVRAHLLHYESLLVDFKKAVSFVLATPYPALDDPDQFSEQEKKHSMDLMRKESESLLREIDRLEMSREGMDKRLKNVMDLAFSSVNLEDSRSMQKLTEASVRDAAAMKQISYLSMVFLPATFVATIFGMNVDEINPGSNENLRNYFAAAIPLTVATIWIVVATQIQVKKPKPHHHHHQQQQQQPPMDDVKDIGDDELPIGKDDFYVQEKNASTQTFKKLGVWTRLWWPVVLISAIFEERKQRRKTMGWLDGGAAP